MKSNFEKVKEFHEKFNLTVNEEPGFYDSTLRLKLIREEFEEVLEAFEQGDLENVAKELTDLLYVVYGSGIAMGLELDLSFEIVHNSNMSKLWDDGLPHYREDGKLLKPPSYKSPDLGELFKCRTET